MEPTTVITATPHHYYEVSGSLPPELDPEDALRMFAGELTTKLGGAFAEETINTILSSSENKWTANFETGHRTLTLRFPHYTPTPKHANAFAPRNNTWHVEFANGPAAGEERNIAIINDGERQPAPVIEVRSEVMGETRCTYQLTGFNLATRRWIYTTEETE